jgi:hypothetical protein
MDNTPTIGLSDPSITHKSHPRITQVGDSDIVQMANLALGVPVARHP